MYCFFRKALDPSRMADAISIILLLPSERFNKRNAKMPAMIKATIAHIAGIVKNLAGPLTDEVWLHIFACIKNTPIVVNIL